MPSKPEPETRSEAASVREKTVRAHFKAQSQSCRSMGSPFMAGLLAAAAKNLTADTEVGAVILDWRGTPSDDALSLRFAAGLHWLALCGIDQDLVELYQGAGIAGEDPASWQCIAQALERHTAALMRFIAGPPQTNEVGRSAVLFGGFMEAARRTGLPLSLREIGASAGLNLNWHRYGYAPSGIDQEWGDVEGAVVLRPEWKGPPPGILDVRVVDARGCDLNPADLAAVGSANPETDEANRLLSYIWPDQKERLERMRGALNIAGAHPPLVERESAATWLKRVVPDQKAGTAQVLFHSIVWMYLPAPERDGIKAVIDQASQGATEDKPFAWLRMEPAEDGKWAELRLSLWPQGHELHLADVCYHGKWLRWLQPEQP